MKTIRIATGIKRIELSHEDFTTLIKIRELLKEHRQTLIDRLLTDLSTYVGYTFQAKPTKAQLEDIINKLTSLKRSEISSIRYDNIIQEIFSQDMTYVKSEAFYFEINEIIADELNPSQLQLVK